MTKAAEWAVRVKQWRASGQRSREFCEGREYTAANLLWWSSHFHRQGFPALAAAKEQVTLARVVRRAEGVREVTSGTSSSVVVELSGARVRVEAGADRTTVAMVLEVLRSVGTTAGAR